MSDDFDDNFGWQSSFWWRKTHFLLSTWWLTPEMATFFLNGWPSIFGPTPAFCRGQIQPVPDNHRCWAFGQPRGCCTEACAGRWKSPLRIRYGCSMAFHMVSSDFQMVISECPLQTIQLLGDLKPFGHLHQLLRSKPHKVADFWEETPSHMVIQIGLTSHPQIRRSLWCHRQETVGGNIAPATAGLSCSVSPWRWCSFHP